MANPDDLEITIVSPDDALVGEMLATKSEEPLLIREGVTATWQIVLAKAGGLPPMVIITLSVVRDVGIAVIAHSIADWIMEKFNGRSERVVVSTKESIFDRGELTRVIEEKITYEHK
jgi:hypothetical protein